MGTRTFADKFEAVIRERREADPKWGIRTLARELAKGDPKNTETVRRRLNKYRPKPGGGAAEVAPTEPTRREIERALGLELDALAPDPQADDLLAALSPERAYLKAERDRLTALEEMFGDRERVA